MKRMYVLFVGIGLGMSLALLVHLMLTVVTFLSDYYQGILP
jgi:hypothetical protein